MSFPDLVREEALVRSRRRCCICQEFAGRNVNVHHIIQEADVGPNDIENAIVLCLRCHAEAGHYNPRHPLGTKYSPEELRCHRDKWWEHCEKHPNEIVGCGLDVTYKKDPSSNGDLHTYWLMISFTNGSPTKQSGFVLELLFPIGIPVSFKHGIYEVSRDVSIGGRHFTQFTIRSSDTIYRDQTVQIMDQARNALSYQMNDDLFDSSERSRWELRWNFYVGNMPPVREARPWGEMHKF